MAIINFAHREITAKIVYYGPPGAGTNTNVEWLFETLLAEEKGAMHTFGPPNEREKSTFFDYVPSGGGPLSGFSTRFRVYSLPGGMEHVTHRDEVLRGTDAIIFVADARRSRIRANIDSLIALEKGLTTLNIRLETLPIVFQVNHTDATDALPDTQVVYDLNPWGFPVVGAVARSGVGVLESHTHVTTATVDRIREALGGNDAAITLTPVHRADRESSDHVVKQHIDRIGDTPGDGMLLADEDTEDREGPNGPKTVPSESDATPPSDQRVFVPVPATPETIELGFQPEGFVGWRPSMVVGTELTADAVSVEIAMERKEGGPLRYLRLNLVNRPMEVAAWVRPSTATAASPRRDVTANLPDKIELSRLLPAPEPDWAPVWYGTAGFLAGAIVGFLMAYLVFT